jgi:3-oxoacyl-[acyl-carrier protein] reductase
LKLTVSKQIESHLGDGDIGEREAAAKTVGAAIQHFGSIGVLVNNAGILRSRHFTTLPPKDW